MIFCSHNAEIPDNCEKAADSSDAEYDDDFEEYDSSEVSKGTLYFYSIFKFFFWKYNIFNIYFTLIFMQIKFWKVFLQWIWFRSSERYWIWHSLKRLKKFAGSRWHCQSSTWSSRAWTSGCVLCWWQSPTKAVSSNSHL